MADTTQEPPASPRSRPEAREQLALVVLWSRAEPHRVGEVAPLANGAWVLGRGEGDGRRCRFGRPGPGARGDGRPLLAPTLSRHQAELQVDGEALGWENTGRLPSRLRGLPLAGGELGPGDLVEVEGELLLGVELRAEPPEDEDLEAPRLGEADAFGIVGETPAAWQLRRDLRFVARRHGHVLLLGPSGSGKESAARALHLLSDRRGRPWVARNAATLPESLVEAELFGHARDYPNAGMPERPGLFAEAEGGTLFLDEIGEIPAALQARLLRVLDSGEVRRLGERGARRLDVRVICATNRPAEALKHDLRARMAHTITVPSLDERRADIPLIARHLVREAARRDREIAERFVDAEAGPRLSVGLIAALVQRRWPNNVRELAAALWEAMRSAPGDTLVETEALRFVPAASDGPLAAADIPKEALEQALARHDGVRERVWRDLGLSSRHQLLRLLRRHGLA